MHSIDLLKSQVFSSFPSFELSNVNLREVRLSDFQDCFEILNEPMTALYIADDEIPATPESARNMIFLCKNLFYSKDSIFWAIADKQNDRYIGSIAFNYVDFQNSRAEISYELRSQYRRRGIMYEALLCVVNFTFFSMGIEKIEAKIMLNNYASFGLLEKIGFKRVEVLHNYRFVRGELVDVYLYRITKR